MLDLVLPALSAGLVKRSNTTDCKSVGIRLRRFESYTLHQKTNPASLGFSIGLVYFEPTTETCFSSLRILHPAPKERPPDWRPFFWVEKTVDLVVYSLYCMYV